MRERWTRSQSERQLDLAAVTALLRPVFPRATVMTFEPAVGGLGNSNMRVTLSDRTRAVLLRLYQRDTSQAAKEAALSARLAATVPVASFLHFSPRDPIIEDARKIVRETIGAGSRLLVSDPMERCYVSRSWRLHTTS